MAKYLCGDVCIRNYTLGSYGYHGGDLYYNKEVNDLYDPIYEGVYYWKNYGKPVVNDVMKPVINNASKYIQETKQEIKNTSSLFK
jgi:hypothetical protein